MRKSKKSPPSVTVRQSTLDVSAHAGRWVAFDPQTYKIVGHGESPDDALQNARPRNGTELVLYYVPKSDAYFVGRTA